MKLAFRDIESFAKKPDARALAVLIYGPDEGLIRERMNMLTKNIVPDLNDAFNIVDLTADKVAETPALLLDEAQSISMLGGRRVVRVRGCGDAVTTAAKNTLGALKPGDNLILLEAGELGPRSSLRLLFEEADHAAALPCYVDDARDLSRVLSDGIKAAGFSISSDALQFMAANVVGDRAVARGEIEKLVTYMGTASKNITLSDVSAAIGESASLPIDDLIRHVGMGQFADADRVLNNLMAEDIPAVTLLRALQNHFLKLHVTKARVESGEKLDGAMAKFRPPIFFKQKPAFEAQVINLSQAQMEQALNIIISAEARCKQTGSEPHLVAGRAVMALCQLTGRALSRRRA